MQAIKQAKIFSRPRVRLEEVLPLATPFSVEIDICSVCNLKCSYCFQADKDGKQASGVRFGMMGLPLFDKILGDLKQFPEKIKKIRLFEFGEPLLHPDLPSMIRRIWDADVAEYVEITTNGVLLTPALGQQLVAAGLSRLNISINAVDEAKYRAVSGAKVDLRALVDNAAAFYRNKGDCHVYIKLSDDGTLTKAEEEEFYRLFGDSCDEIFIERLSPIWRDTDVNRSVAGGFGPYGQPLAYKTVCPLIFTRLVINHDGVAVACCVDWSRQYVIGDVASEPVRAVWTGRKMRDLQLRHLRGEREDVPMCKGCNALMSCTIDNIDAHAAQLIEKFVEANGD
ncbi:MAG TPA: radical SAM protein [Rhodocyclaceae bacterium]|nr:radical SAM protein [Rhodocyclaceae bacterium]